MPRRDAFDVAGVPWLLVTAVLGVLLLGAAGGGILTMRRADTATPKAIPASFLVSADAADNLVPAELRPVLDRLRPRARGALESKTVLGRALRLERLVHTALLRTDATCVGYATVMTALGRELGLPVRITFGGTGISNYDTHTTVSLWLPEYRRWGIVDPTFGGTFTAAQGSRPLNELDLRNSIVNGWWRRVVWHPSSPDSTPVSSYYVDPVLLFRYVGVYATVGGTVAPVALPDSKEMAAAQDVVSPVAFADDPAARTVPVYPWLPSNLRGFATAGTVFPPVYAQREIWHGRLTLPATLRVPDGPIVVWTSTSGVDVENRAMTTIDDGSLSPIVNSDGKVPLRGTGRTTVRVYAVQRFSAAAPPA